MSKERPNLIAAEDLENCQAWAIPEIDPQGNIISSAEKEERERLAEEQLRRHEIMEDVEIDEGSFDFTQPMTAERLQEIVETAEADGQRQGYEKGHSEGTDKGYAEGKQQGLNEMRAQLADEKQRLASISTSLMSPLAPQDDALERMLLNMVCSLTEAVVKRELLTDSGHILTVVQEAIAALPVGSKNITLYLNPDDLALVESYSEDRQKDWKFLSDVALLPGGCRIHTAESQVDYSVEKRLQDLLKEFAAKQLAGDIGELEDDVITAQIDAIQPAVIIEKDDVVAVDDVLVDDDLADETAVTADSSSDFEMASEIEPEVEPDASDEQTAVDVESSSVNTPSSFPSSSLSNDESPVDDALSDDQRDQTPEAPL